jgi:ATP-binding cassette subfamily B protein
VAGVAAPGTSMIDQVRAQVERFASRILDPRRGRFEVPVIQQMGPTECGAACLAMTIGYHGADVRVEDLIEVLGSSARDGVTALGLLQAARRYDLVGRGVKVDIADLPHLEPGTILHWEFNHFVVLERVRRDSVLIVDPADGRRAVPMDRFRKAFTGVALVFERGPLFRPQPRAGGRLWRYIGALAIHRRVWAHVLLAGLLMQVFGLALPAMTTALVDRIVPRGDRDTFLVLVAGLCSIAVFQVVINAVRGHLMLRVRALFDAQMTTGFLAHLLALPFPFFMKRSSGDLLRRLDSNTAIRETLTTSVLGALIDGLLVMAYAVMLLLLDPAIGFLVVGLGAVQVLLYRTFIARQKELAAEGLRVQAKLTGMEIEILKAIQTIKTSAAESQALDLWGNVFVSALNNSLKQARFGIASHAASQLVDLLSPIFVLTIGTYKVLAGQLSLGTMLGLNMMALGFLRPFLSLIEAASQLELLGTSLDRLEDVFQQPPEIEGNRLLRTPRLTGRVSLEHVSFRYGETSPYIVQDLSLDLAQGEFVALVGASGSGKSTLACLLLGLYPPTAGRVCHDGISLSELDVRLVRGQIGTVLQNTYLFSGTIRENITFGYQSLPWEAMVAAAEMVELNEEISRMPLGYETPVGEGGGALSGGQRQRLAIARALVRHPSMLVLDEATSSLDAITEQRIHQRLEALSCTRLVIAHRLSTVVHADRILVMEGGRIVESGRHSELLGRRGVYARLVAAQLRQQTHPLEDVAPARGQG